MDFNTLLLRLGISSENFINKEGIAIPIEGGMLYEVEQQKIVRKCPYCECGESVIIGYYYTETKCSESENFKDILRIIRKAINFCSNRQKIWLEKAKNNSDF